MKKSNLKIFINVIMVLFITIFVIRVTDVPYISESAREYDFIEIEEFKPTDWLSYGMSIEYVDGHRSDAVEIAINESKNLKTFKVYIDKESLILILEESNKGTKKDRLYYSESVNDIKGYLDNVKVYRNGRREYFVKISMAVE